MKVVQRQMEKTQNIKSYKPYFVSRLFSRLFAAAVNLPARSGEQEIQKRWSRGLVLLLSVVVCLFSVCLFDIESVSATSSYLTMSMSTDTINMDIASASANGTFKKSANNNISVTTNHYTGYTMSIKTTDASATATLPALKSTKTGNTDRVTSIESALTEEQFKAVGAISYNNMYGYLPSKFCTTSNNTMNCSTNTSFLPAPNLTGDILDITSDNNNEQARDYTVAIGARVDNLKPFGTYTNTFEVLLVSNAIPYTLAYDGTAVGGMPTDQSGSSSVSDISLSSNIPTRNGYTFNGWCTVAPTTSQYNDTCSGDTYAASATYTLSETTANNIHLYAMWKRNTMQNVSEWGNNIAINQETTAIDTRDGKTYSVARLCMAKANDECTSSTLWMTQNLDLLVGGAGVGNLTSVDSDINEDLGATMGYSTNGNVITWTPGSTLKVPAVITNHESNNPENSLTGWTNSNDYPYQAEGGNYYVYGSGDIYASLAACVNGGHTIEQCSHYHIGNYYNWSAAIASNNSTDIATQYQVAPNSVCPKGWRLPNGLTKDGTNTIQSEFNSLFLAAGVTNSSDLTGSQNLGYTHNGYNMINAGPYYYVRSGRIGDAKLYDFSSFGEYWSNTAIGDVRAYYLLYYAGAFYPAGHGIREHGWSIRCIMR